MLMLVLSNSTPQTLVSGQAIIFDTVVFKANECMCCHRKNSPSIKLTKRNHPYKIEYHANIGPDGGNDPSSLIIRVDGEPLPETLMTAPAIADGTFANVSAGTVYENCCCEMARISIINVSENNVTVAANSSLIIS